MSQYGQGSKNPPWARSSVPQSGGQVQPMIPAAMPQMANPSLLQYPTVFQTGSMGQQVYAGVGAIQYPTRALNSAAFGGSSGINVSGQGSVGGGGIGGGGSVSSSSSGASSQSNNHSMGKNQRVFTGTVTKIQDNFGFVDEDVFFQTSCCVKGSTPQVDDRVLVEAVYNPAMPFKWNATRIQVLNSKDGHNSGSRFSQGYNAVPPPSNDGGRPSGSGGSGRNFQIGGDRGGNRSDRRNRNRPPSKERDDRKRKREDTRDRSLERDRERVRSPPPKRKSKSPVRRARPAARYQPPARYAVVVPKFALANSEFDVIELKKRYTNLYVPSDFFFSNSKWSESLPLGKPFSLNSPCQFHVMNREIDPVTPNDAVLEPPDADYSFVAKVMLLSSPGLDELFSKSGCASTDSRGSRSVTPEDSESAEDNGGMSQHPSRLIHFLVGTRGQETMAIGGPWSPSLDGADPVNDASVLIRTAIRTCKALTSIDLTPCTQWLRFLEVHYYRGESCHKGKLVPARVETVVLFVPDVWSSAPSRLEWDSIAADYKDALERKINPASCSTLDDSTASASEMPEEKSDAEIKEGDSADVDMKREPTHFSQLDVKSMKVQELRDELDARNLPTKGIKSQLAARLSKALKSEAETEGEQPPEDCSVVADTSSETIKPDHQEGEETQSPSKDAPAKEKDEPSPASSSKEKEKEKESDKPAPVKMSEKDRSMWEKRYKLPETPHIIVHPNRTAKAGRFNCAAISLSSLLGYRIDDTKEHSFEVSLFAEVFNEMLMRDYGFSIYISLVNTTEKVKEDDKDKKKPKDSCKEKEKEKDKDSKDKAKEEKSDKEGDSAKEEKIEATSDHETDKKSDDTKKLAEVKKVKIVDSNLLLACFYFDTSRIGYFLEKDLEDLLFSLGLTISRSQVRKLVQKVAQRDQIYYRKLAEKFVEVKTEGGTSCPKKEGTVELTPDGLKELGLGNRRLLKDHWLANSVKDESQTEKKSDAVDMETSSGLVKYNGAVVDIEKLMSQLSKSEKNRIEAEKALGKMKADFLKAKENCSKTERTVKDLNGEINTLNDKLASAQSTLSTIMANEKKYATACHEIYERLGPLVNAEEKQPSVIEIAEGEEDSKKSH